MPGHQYQSRDERVEPDPVRARFQVEEGIADLVDRIHIAGTYPHRIVGDAGQTPTPVGRTRQFAARSGQDVHHVDGDADVRCDHHEVDLAARARVATLGDVAPGDHDSGDPIFVGPLPQPSGDPLLGGPDAVSCGVDDEHLLHPPRAERRKRRPYNVIAGQRHPHQCW
ncbi:MULTISPECIES: hypothetical protein [Nocardia]|uniref:Uncharacterized protein n=1 Tax=Nocardia aurea TaxID=2144174 RepID=A0ABV3G1F0_9NOCA|nr:MULTISPECIES: hypothetical protein [Nocardia]